MSPLPRATPLLVLALLSLTATWLAVSGQDFPGDPDSLPGWMGADHTVHRPSLEARVIDTQRIIQLSAKSPRAYLYKGFLTDEECDYLINYASPKLERSKVVADLDSNAHVSQVRTSSGSFIPKGSDDIITSIEKRIEQWTFLPIANQEPLQILRYLQGQQYVPHVDYFPDQPERQVGGQRYATVLMYLNNVTLGGETVFTNAKDPTPKDDTWSDCAKGFLAVKPQKGDAVLFFSMHPDGSPDPSSLHYACPVVEGVKWSAPKWIRVRPYENHLGNPDVCEDSNGMCAAWAAIGECEKNPMYMVGTEKQTGACRKACGACTPDKPVKAA